MMQRAICRIIRRTRGNFRENDCPGLASEEVRQKNKSKEDFSPPKHSITEALGWTTGLILTYEFTHRQRRQCLGNTSPGSQDRLLLYIRNCPFAIAKEAVAQPTITPFSTAKSVRSPCPKRAVNPHPTRKTIDKEPFLKEPEKFFQFKDAFYPKRSSLDEESDDDEEGVHFDPTISKYDEVRANKPHDKRVTSLAEKVTADLFSAYGAFKLLTLSKDSKAVKPSDIPTMEALDLLEKGAELSSSRAL